MNAHVQAEIARRVMILVRHFTPFEIQDDAVVDQFSPAERYVYDSNLKSYRDLKNMLQTAEEERHWLHDGLGVPFHQTLSKLIPKKQTRQDLCPGNVQSGCRCQSGS